LEGRWKCSFQGGWREQFILAVTNLCIFNMSRACLKDIYFGAWYDVLKKGVKLIPPTSMRLTTHKVFLPCLAV
jgi:hypothetical protein